MVAPYSSALLQRFDELYVTTDTESVLKILKKEFPQDFRDRKDASINLLHNLAYRRNLKKEQNKPVQEARQQVVLDFPRPENPQYTVNEVEVRGRMLPVEFFTDLVMMANDQDSLTDCVRKLCLKYNLEEPDDHLITTVRYILDSQIRVRYSELPKNQEQAKENIIKFQRKNLARKLHLEKWRKAAILAELASKFPTLPELSMPELVDILRTGRGVYGSSTASRERREDREQEVVPDGLYAVSIAGANLNYKANVSLADAQRIMRALYASEVK